MKIMQKIDASVYHWSSEKDFRVIFFRLGFLIDKLKNKILLFHLDGGKFV